MTVGSWGGVGIRTAILPEIAYKMTKAFWSNIGEIHKKAAGFKDSIKLENAMKEMASSLHPGAARYYKEIGMNIPRHLVAK